MNTYRFPFHRSPGTVGEWLVSRDPNVRARAYQYLSSLGTGAADALYDTWRSHRNYRVLRDWLYTTFSSFVIAYSIPHKSWGWGNCLFVFGVCGLFNWLWHGRPTLCRSGQRLALLRELARYDPLRAMEPLLLSWLNTRNKETDEARADARLLATLYSDAQQHPYWQQPGPKLHRRIRAFLGRTFTPGRVRRELAVPGTVSAEQADLSVTLLQILARIGEPDDMALLKRIAATPPSRTPNRRFVQEAAKALMGAPTAVQGARPPLVSDPVSYGIQVAPPAAIPPQIQRIGES